MTERTSQTAARAADALTLAQDKRLLILEAPYYADVTAQLIAGALEVLAQNACTYDRFAVPGALEIPQALSSAVKAGLVGGDGKKLYAGAVALGCVIRGETAHYDIVCNNTNHWLMETVIQHRIPLGNGILTVDTHGQAMARASGGAAGKGGDAVRACLRLIWLNTQFAAHAGAAGA
jgi:6,7-dimethyl-8-ribityllumazine synthase